MFDTRRVHASNATPVLPRFRAHASPCLELVGAGVVIHGGVLVLAGIAAVVEEGGDGGAHGLDYVSYF